MHAHVVIAHPESRSYNGHLAGVTKKCLENEGWAVSISDLYENRFDPCERLSHYSSPHDETRFYVQNEQRHASDTKTLPPEIKEEIKALDSSDLLILQYPMWWHLPPAILKGWFDRVFVYGDVYTSKKRFEAGRFSGKKAMLSVTVGTSRETYAFNGRSGDIDLMLWPVNFNLAFVGYTVLSPFVAYGVESGIQYSGAEANAERLGQIEADLLSRLKSIHDLPDIPFNTMSEWGEDGRIVKSASAHSPFVRHKKKLDLG